MLERWGSLHVPRLDPVLIVAVCILSVGYKVADIENLAVLQVSPGASVVSIVCVLIAVRRTSST